MARTTVNTPNENIVLSSPIPYGFILPSLLKTRDGLDVKMRAMSNTKNTMAYRRRVLNFI
jgi:hypothetical protein